MTSEYYLYFPLTRISFLSVPNVSITVVKINKEKYLVLDNQSGGRAVLEYQKEFSSAIPYRQIYTNGHLDLSKTENNLLSKEQLDNYLVKKFNDKEEALSAAEEGLTDNVKGTSDIFSN